MSDAAQVARTAADYLQRRFVPPTSGDLGGDDRTLAEGLDGLHSLVGRVLAHDTALTALERQAAAGQVGERTLQRVALAIEDAAEADQAFADQLSRLVTALQAREGRDGATASGERSIVIGGDNTGIISTGDHATIHQNR